MKASRENTREAQPDRDESQHKQKHTLKLDLKKGHCADASIRRVDHVHQYIRGDPILGRFSAEKHGL